jgi:predicted Zn-dependent protease
MFDGAKVEVVREGQQMKPGITLGATEKTALPKDFLNVTNVTSREGSNSKQWHALGINNALKRHKPGDAYAILGLTNQDLYPGPKWNFVFGWASYTEGVGCFSFCRYDPEWDGIDDPDRE